MRSTPVQPKAIEERLKMEAVSSLPSVNETVVLAISHKWSLLLSLLLPIFVAAAIAWGVTPQYQAESSVLVRSGREYAPQLDTVDRNVAPPTATMQETIETEVQILKSNDLIRDTLQAVSIERIYPGLIEGLMHAGDDQEPGAGPWAWPSIQTNLTQLWHALGLHAGAPPHNPEDVAARALRKDVIVAPVKLSNVIQISLRNRDPAVAREALSALLAAFEERHVKAFSAHRSSFLEQQISGNLEQLTNLERERSGYRNEHGLFSVAEQRSELLKEQARQTQEMHEAKIREGVLDLRARYLAEQIRSLPKTIHMDSTDTASPVTEEVQRRLQKLETEQFELLSRYGTNSPYVKHSQAMITATNEWLARHNERTQVMRTGPNPVLPGLQVDLLTSNAEFVTLADKIKALDAGISATGQKLQDLSSEELKLFDLDRRINQLDLANSTIRQRLEEARFLEDLDRAHIASISIIEQPVASYVPVFPNKALLLAGGGMIGLMASGFMLLLWITFGDYFLTIATAERLLGIQVFAASTGPQGRRRLPGPATKLANVDYGRVGSQL